jgi:hypothetical protein
MEMWRDEYRGRAEGILVERTRRRIHPLQEKAMATYQLHNSVPFALQSSSIASPETWKPDHIHPSYSLHVETYNKSSHTSTYPSVAAPSALDLDNCQNLVL